MTEHCIVTTHRKLTHDQIVKAVDDGDTRGVVLHVLKTLGDVDELRQQ